MSRQLQRDGQRPKRSPARFYAAGEASGAVVKRHVCHAERLLPRRLERVFYEIGGDVASRDYQLALRLALFIVEVDTEIGTAALRRIVRRVIRGGRP